MTEVTELVELSADAAGLSRQDRLAQLRRQIASIPSRRRYVVFGTECFRGWCFPGQVQQPSRVLPTGTYRS